MRCAAAGKPLLVTWHELWGAYWRGYVGSLRAPAYRAVEWLTAQLGDATIAVSELTRGRLAAARRHGGGGGGRPAGGAIHLVPNGIAVARVRAAAAPRAGESPNGAPPLIYAGRLLEHKRLELVLRAVRILARNGTGGDGPLLTVFGEGPDRPRLERLAGDLGVAGRVHFRGHVKTSEEVWHELGRARIAVQPSAREGFGLFPLEAMAAGLPVVYCGSTESAVGELVRDGIDGVEVAADPGAFATTLAPLLAPEGEDERRRLSANALARAAAYDWDEVARRVEEVCLDLIARRRR
jgi:glycosyltransferase involved in cell wall biosynthesis